MTNNNQGILGFILVILAMVIALFNPIMGIISLVLIYILAFIMSKPTGNNADNPFL